MSAFILRCKFGHSFSNYQILFNFLFIFYCFFCNTDTIRWLSERLFHGCVRCIFLPGKSVAPDFRLLIFPYFATPIYYIGYEKLFVFVPDYYF